MATGTAGTAARQFHTQQTHYLRKAFTFADTATTFTVGTLPAGACIMAATSGVDVQTVFNALTTNRVNIGITGATAKYASNSSMLALGFVAMAVAVGHKVTVDTPIILTTDFTGTAATTGEAIVVISYIVDNDG